MDRVAREEMDALLNEGIETALRFLNKWTEFYPIALGLANEGEIVHIHLQIEEEQPLSVADRPPYRCRQVERLHGLEKTFDSTGCLESGTSDPFGFQNDAIPFRQAKLSHRLRLFLAPWVRKYGDVWTVLKCHLTG